MEFKYTYSRRPAILLKKETLAQVFSCEFCEISKNTLLHRAPMVAASKVCHSRQLQTL